MRRETVRLHAETEFLLRAALPHPTLRDRERLTATASGVRNWDDVWRRAETVRSVPMVARAVAACPSGMVPSSVVDRLQRQSMVNTSRNVFLCARLRDLVSAFERSGVHALPFKGIVLALQAYEAVGDRQVEDLDFIVVPESMPEAMAVLDREGFSPMIPLRPVERTAHIRRGWGYSVWNADHSLAVELDTGVGPDYFAGRFPMRELMARTVTVRDHDVTFTALAPEPLLVLLCVHAAKHVWARPQWLGDIVGILRRGPIDWNAVEAWSARAGARRMLDLGLYLAMAFADIEVPGRIADHVRNDRHIPALADLVLRRLDAGRGTQEATAVTARFHLRCRERVRDRIHYVATALWRPGFSDWRWIRLPPPLFPLYYLLRPVRLLTVAIARGVRRR